MQPSCTRRKQKGQSHRAEKMCQRDPAERERERERGADGRGKGRGRVRDGHTEAEGRQNDGHAQTDVHGQATPQNRKHKGDAAQPCVLAHTAPPPGIGRTDKKEQANRIDNRQELRHLTQAPSSGGQHGGSRAENSGEWSAANWQKHREDGQVLVAGHVSAKATGDAMAGRAEARNSTPREKHRRQETGNSRSTGNRPRTAAARKGEPRKNGSAEASRVQKHKHEETHVNEPTNRMHDIGNHNQQPPRRGRKKQA